VIGRLRSVVLDCPDPRALARFYSELTGLEQAYADDEWVSLGPGDGGVKLAFQRAPGHRPPTFPDPASSQQFHLDVTVDDVEAAEAKVLAIGARRLPGGDEEDDNFRVYADPAGHPFCLVWD
jgi:catechol 2,3-dioxygenase-like lactoylglutathione lyase family enzyme